MAEPPVPVIAAATDLELDPLAGEQGGDEGLRLATFWKDKLKEVEDNPEYKKWLKRGIAIEKRYRDERDYSNESSVTKRYSALWANVQVLHPALYARMPVPVAERRFKDKDPAGRTAAQILERGLRNEIEICGFDEALHRAVGDYLLPGAGIVWVRYEPEVVESVSIPPDSEMDMEDPEDQEEDNVLPAEGGLEEISDIEGVDDIIDRVIGGPKGPNEEVSGEIAPQDDKLLDTGSRILRESTPVDYIQWNDFFMFPARARTWKEVVGIGKRVYMTRDQCIRRFGEEIGKAIPLQSGDLEKRRRNLESLKDNQEEKAEVYEIWSKTKSEVFWIAEGYEYLCDRKDDPLKLEGFFPVPCPLFANPTNNTLIPVPDYIQYQDQAIQIDELTQRIAMLAKACKVAGVYNAAARSIRRLLQEGVENELIPVDDWTAFAEKGGVAGNISLLPLKEVMGVIQELMMIKEKCIEEMDRLTGINDIMRGTSDARETLGGVRLKSNNTGSRLTRRQQEVARFARDTVRIMADIMCQHFSPQSLIEVSGVMYEESLGGSVPELAELIELMEMPGMGVSQPMLGAPPPMMALPPPAPMGAPPMGNVVPFPGGGTGGQPPMPPPGAPPQMGPPPGAPPEGPPEPDRAMDALKRIAKGINLLRNERLRGFRVDLEVDSTLYGDSDQEKGKRIEFINAVTEYLTKSMPMVVQVPEIAPLLGKLLQFGIRGFKVGRDLEVVISDFVDQAGDLAKQYKEQQSQNNPEAAKAEAEIRKAEVDIQKTSLEAQINQQEGAAEIKRQHLESQSEAFNAQLDIQQTQIEAQMKQLDIEIEKIRAQTAALQAQLAARDVNLKAAMPPKIPGQTQGPPNATGVPPQSSTGV